MKTVPFLFALFYFLFPKVYAQNAENNRTLAKININKKNNMLIITGNVQNQSSLYFSYHYLLLVKKYNEQNNISVNKQSGKFTLHPKEAKKLSSMRINSSKGERINVYLYIRDEDKNELIAKDTVVVKGDDKVQLQANTPLLKGMIIDQTKTKFGKDFYDDLFSIYNQYPQKFNFTITISERPFRGMTSIIEIEAARKKIYRFISNPNEEYRERQVSLTLRKLSNYAQAQQSLINN